MNDQGKEDGDCKEGRRKYTQTERWDEEGDMLIMEGNKNRNRRMARGINGREGRAEGG